MLYNRIKKEEASVKHNNNASATSRYYTSRMQVKCWDSLRNRSCRPHSHPNQHSETELTPIQNTYRRYGHEGLAQVYVECNKRGYKRSYDRMIKIILILK